MVDLEIVRIIAVILGLLLVIPHLESHTKQATSEGIQTRLQKVTVSSNDEYKKHTTKMNSSADHTSRNSTQLSTRRMPAH